MPTFVLGDCRAESAHVDSSARLRSEQADVVHEHCLDPSSHALAVCWLSIPLAIRWSAFSFSPPSLALCLPFHVASRRPAAVSVPSATTAAAATTTTVSVPSPATTTLLLCVLCAVCPSMGFFALLIIDAVTLSP